MYDTVGNPGKPLGGFLGGTLGDAGRARACGAGDVRRVATSPRGEVLTPMTPGTKIPVRERRSAPITPSASRRPSSGGGAGDSARGLRGWSTREASPRRASHR